MDGSVEDIISERLNTSCAQNEDECINAKPANSDTIRDYTQPLRTLSGFSIDSATLIAAAK